VAKSGDRPRGRHRATHQRSRARWLAAVVGCAVVGSASWWSAAIETEASDVSAPGLAASERRTVPPQRPVSTELGSRVVVAGEVLERDPRPEVPESGTGRFEVVAGVGQSRPGRPTGVTAYRVEVEGGLPFDHDAIAQTIDQTLADERGWTSRGHLLSRVGADVSPDIRIMVASPSAVDRLCAPLLTRGRLSCRNGDLVVINAWRWSNGAAAYDGDITGYRRYLVNHETGHALGYGHEECPAPGSAAPVMLQQTKTLDGCRSNPWPSIS